MKFFWTNFWTICIGPFCWGGGRPLVLSVLRSRRQTFVTEEGVEDELLVCRKGWEVVVLVTATDKYIACVYSPAFDLVVP